MLKVKYSLRDKKRKETIMKKVKIKSFNVSGMSIRTNNEKEMNPETSTIFELWNILFEKNILNITTASETYGVYSSYENNDNGDYTVVAGIKTDKKNEFETITIQEGEYLVFTKDGSIPKAVIEAWEDVWSYFNSEVEEKRAYKTDFERYIGVNKVEVYIGIK